VEPADAADDVALVHAQRHAAPGSTGAEVASHGGSDAAQRIVQLCGPRVKHSGKSMRPVVSLDVPASATAWRANRMTSTSAATAASVLAPALRHGLCSRIRSTRGERPFAPSGTTGCVRSNVDVGIRGRVFPPRPASWPNRGLAPAPQLTTPIAGQAGRLPYPESIDEHDTRFVFQNAPSCNGLVPHIAYRRPGGCCSYGS